MEVIPHMFKKSIHLWAFCLVAVVLCAACADAAEGEKAESSGSSGGDVVATIGEEKITLEEVDAQAMSSNIKPYQDLYDARRQVIEQIVAEKLFEKEAASRGVSIDELVDAEITKKVPPITEAQVQVFFEQNQSRMGGRTLEQMNPQIRNYLASQSAKEARDTFLKQLKEKAGVTIALSAPRVEVVVAENDPYRGPAAAKVTIVEYSDFQ
jgi:hypothetical protein